MHFASWEHEEFWAAPSFTLTRWIAFQNRQLLLTSNKFGTLILSLLLPKAYLELSQTSMMKLFWENSLRLLAVNYFHKKASS